MKSNRSVLILIIALAAMLGAIGLYVYANWYLASERNALKEQLQLLANEQALYEERVVIASLVEETAADRAELATYILDGDEGTVALLSEFDRLADFLGIELETNSLQVSEAKDSFSQLTVGLTVTGSVAGVERFVTLLETMPYQGTPLSLRFSSDRSVATGLETASASITISFSITNV